jgi:hypothetical protein
MTIFGDGPGVRISVSHQRGTLTLSLDSVETQSHLVLLCTPIPIGEHIVFHNYFSSYYYSYYYYYSFSSPLAFDTVHNKIYRSDLAQFFSTESFYQTLSLIPTFITIFISIKAL